MAKKYYKLGPVWWTQTKISNNLLSKSSRLLHRVAARDITGLGHIVVIKACFCCFGVVVMTRTWDWDVGGFLLYLGSFLFDFDNGDSCEGEWWWSTVGVVEEERQGCEKEEEINELSSVWSWVRVQIRPPRKNQVQVCDWWLVYSPALLYRISLLIYE